MGIYGKAGRLRLIILSLLLSPAALAQTSKGVPVYKITPVQSKIDFSVKASIELAGTFDKWNASLTFTSDDVATGVLNVTIQAGSVNTGSHMKDDKLRSKDFFNVIDDPNITFRSNKFVQTAPHTYDVQGTFTIRGVSKPETLVFVADRDAPGTGVINGTMAFDRKDFGMDSGIPFIHIGDRVEVTIDFTAKRTSGPPLLFKQ
jgi:polyisoprenoid-binding protein YceI